MRSLSKKDILRSEVFKELRNLSEDIIAYLWICADDKLIRERVERFVVKDRYVSLVINGDDLAKLNIISEKRQYILDEDLFKKIDSSGVFMNKEQELDFVKKIVAV